MKSLTETWNDSEIQKQMEEIQDLDAFRDKLIAKEDERWSYYNKNNKTEKKIHLWKIDEINKMSYNELREKRLSDEMFKFLVNTIDTVKSFFIDEVCYIIEKVNAFKEIDKTKGECMEIAMELVNNSSDITNIIKTNKGRNFDSLKYKYTLPDIFNEIEKNYKLSLEVEKATNSSLNEAVIFDVDVLNEVTSSNVETDAEANIVGGDSEI